MSVGFTIVIITVVILLLLAGTAYGVYKWKTSNTAVSNSATGNNAISITAASNVASIASSQTAAVLASSNMDYSKVYLSNGAVIVNPLFLDHAELYNTSLAGNTMYYF